MTAPTLAAPDSWQLVTRAQAGDTDAFAELYERYRETVFRFLWFKVGHRPTVEDLSHDVWVRVLKRIGSVDYQGKDIAAWIVTIARNAAADHFKSGRYRLEVTTGDVQDPAGSHDADWHMAPEFAAAAYLTNRELLAAVQRLSDEQREVLVLRFLCGLSGEETAAAMGKTLGAVKALQTRAAASMRRDPKVQALAVSSC